MGCDAQKVPEGLQQARPGGRPSHPPVGGHSPFSYQRSESVEVLFVCLWVQHPAKDTHQTITELLQTP